MYCNDRRCTCISSSKTYSRILAVFAQIRTVTRSCRETPGPHRFRSKCLNVGFIARSTTSLIYTGSDAPSQWSENQVSAIRLPAISSSRDWRTSGLTPVQGNVLLRRPICRSFLLLLLLLLLLFMVVVVVVMLLLLYLFLRLVMSLFVCSSSFFVACLSTRSSPPSTSSSAAAAAAAAVADCTRVRSVVERE
ncbi:hypothetical protein VTO42DRAFT_5288 [Malbranchea cinnamomea]